jgi:biopolymer transport protein ExbD
MAGGGSAATPSGKKKARIEIIPLIDVVFFLLATFVLFTLSLDKIQSVPVNLPVATPPREDTPKEPVIIQVSEGETVYWNREAISITEVTPRVLQYKQAEATPRILVSGDDRARFGMLISVLDRVRECGIEQVSIETNYRASGR